jgi:glycosyltransferase involved in cell wall biosynthesis
MRPTLTNGFHNKLVDLKIPNNVGDFRLMARTVIEAMKPFPESRRFMEGLFAWVGFRTAVISYTRKARVAGKTKFSSWKRWNFGLEGITSLTSLPLPVWNYFGFPVAAFSFIYVAYLIPAPSFTASKFQDTLRSSCRSCFFSGVQMIGFGILDEYIGRIYIESKRRPLYLIRSRYTRSTSHERRSRGDFPVVEKRLRRWTPVPSSSI